MKQMVFYLLSNPKNGIIHFGAQTKGWLATSEPNGKSAYDAFVKRILHSSEF